MKVMNCKISSGIIIIVIFLIHTSLIRTVAAEGMMGIDKEPDLSGTPLDSIEHTSPSVDLEVWTLSATLDDVAASNGTTLELTTQICINTGICFAPEPQEMTTTDQGLTWTGSVPTPEGHAYVNWRITADFAESEQVMPESGWAKTWSSCWVSFDAEGQPVSGGDGCVERQDEGDDSLPAAGTVLGLATLAGAAALSRRSTGFQQ